MYALGHTGEVRKDMIYELLNQLKANNAELFIYEHTLREIINNLLACKEKVRNRKSGFGEGKFTIEHFSSLSGSVSRIDEAIEDLEQNINDLDIRIFEDNLFSKSNHSNVIEDTEFRKLLSQNMGNSQHKEESIEADYNSILMTKMIRNNKISKFLHSSKAIFITKSKVLVYQTYKYFRETVPYIPTAMTYNQLSTRLLLLNGVKSSEFPMSIIMETCYATVFPSDSVWNEYINMLNEKLDNREINKVDYVRYRTRNTIQRDIRYREELGNDNEVIAANFDEIIKDHDEKEREEKQKELLHQQELHKKIVSEKAMEIANRDKKIKEHEDKEKEREKRIDDLKKEFGNQYDIKHKILDMILYIIIGLEILINILNIMLIDICNV
jgi:hypothetical protein